MGIAEQVQFKILSILANHMGEANFSYELISAKEMHVNYEMWEQIMILMQEDGYIKGLATDQTLSDPFPRIVEPIRVRITLKGIKYVEDNSVVAAVKKVLEEAGDLAWKGKVIH